MLSKILGSFGSFLGGMLGGGPISSILKYAGRYIGNYIEHSAYSPETFFASKGHIDDIYNPISNFPYPISIVFGTGKVRGRVIWSLDLREVAQESEDIRFFKDSKRAKSKVFHTNYKYFADFALLICRGEIQDIGRVWINNIESDIGQYQFMLYRGSDNQAPDTFISQYEKNAPAFRGLAYIVFSNFPLEKFNNKIPVFDFEVIAKPKNILSKQIKNICIIPASGEFVYDTETVLKIQQDDLIPAEIAREAINMHNNEHVADALHNLNTLMYSFPNLEYVSVTVAWFGDHLDAGLCNIYPAIENRSINSTQLWSVGEYSRINAREISKDIEHYPLYGGTISDASLVRYLKTLKSRNLKIVFNPMLLMDIIDKPWRGHISGDTIGVKKFFNHDKGYKKYILHYARLVKDYVDVFLIGSELVALTRVRDQNLYPAIGELINLAKEVRLTLHKGTKISYGADWSEYHHFDGYYNLDDLWASDYIDFVAIDVYFPLTDSVGSNVTKKDIIEGFNSKEGFEYYFDNGDKKLLDPQWAWKNLKYWWENPHINSDNTRSSWIPKSKKIWFTEFGFPSIDKATNQPNIFYDPVSRDGGFPQFSNGEVDFEIQRKAIEVFLEYWDNNEMVEKSFLYCWDARPYPAFPHQNFWRDAYLWSRGHWVNGKLFHDNLSSIITSLCLRSGFGSDDFNIWGLEDNIDGMVLGRVSSAWDTILMLKAAFLFEIRTNNQGIVEFISREYLREIEVDSKDLVDYGLDGITCKEITEKDIIHNIKFSFLDAQRDFQNNYINLYSEKQSYGERYSMNIPIVMNMNTARLMGKKILANESLGRMNFKFKLPFTYYDSVDVGDIVRIKNSHKVCNLLVQEICYSNFILEIAAISSPKGSY